MRKRIVLTLGIVAIILAVCNFINFIKFPQRSTDVIYSNIDDYGNFETFRGYSNLDIFPTSLPQSSCNTEFYYEEDSSGLFDSSYQVYLKCGYNNEDYQNEVKRLKAIEEEYDKEVKHTWLDNGNYKFPAIVAIENNNHCFEYALTDDDNLIIYYIFLQFIYEKDIKFSTDLLPHNYINPNEHTEKEKQGDSIYLFPLENGDSHGTY